MRGSLTVHEQGIIITTSGFSKGPRRKPVESRQDRISLIDGEELLDLLIEHGIGVTQEQHTVLALDEEWWGEVAGEAPSAPAVPLPNECQPPQIAYPVTVHASVRGQTIEATLLDAAGHVRFEGDDYRSPSGAGTIASGWKSCNGWEFWRYHHPETGEWRRSKN